MFLIGIFGIENKNKEIMTLKNLNCKKCNKSTSAKLIKNFDFFHIFFIPVFKWNEKYYVVCDQCKAIYNISKDKGKAIENGENVEITYWDLQDVDTGIYNNEFYNSKVCSSCGKTVESNFEYCPYCGAKIRD